jgi:hypothetical protein
MCRAIFRLFSNFRRVLNVVCFHLGNSPASQFYMPTFRNTLSCLHRQIGVKVLHINPPMKMKQSLPKRRHIKSRRLGIIHKKAYNNLNLLFPVLCPICHLLALLGAHHIFHVSGLRVITVPHVLKEEVLGKWNWMAGGKAKKCKGMFWKGETARGVWPVGWSGCRCKSVSI